MLLLSDLSETVGRDLEEDSKNELNSSLYCDVVPAKKWLSWLPWVKPHNSMYYEFIYTYRVLKKPCLPFTSSGRWWIPNNLMAQLLIALNYAAINAHKHVQETKVLSLPASIEYEETNHLSNIDGYAATTGVRTRIVLRTGLPPEEKKRAIEELLKKAEIKSEPAVFLWKVNQR